MAINRQSGERFGGERPVRRNSNYRPDEDQISYQNQRSFNSHPERDDYSHQSGGEYDSRFSGNEPSRNAFYGSNQNRFENDNQSSRNYSGKGPKGWKRSDERIREDVCECLERNHLIDASEITVQVEEGIVTLSGQVDSRRIKRLAEDVIESFSGVKDVRNELSVQDRFESDSSSKNSSSRKKQGSTDPANH